MPTTCIIFDIDGTLVDSGKFEDTLYATAVRDVLGSVQIRTVWGDYEHVTDAGIVLEICNDNGLEVEDTVQKVRIRFGEIVSDYLSAGGPCTPTPGALPFWRELRNSPDVEVGIATGGWGHTARMKLESAGFVHTGVPLVSSDDLHVRTRIMKCCRALLPTTDSTIYIGDGEWDRVAAEQVEWRFIGVGDRLRGKCVDWIPNFTAAGLLDRILFSAARLCDK